MNTIVIPEILLSLAPVFIFLAVLIVFDSYKLVSFRSVIIAIGIGAIIAIFSFGVNTAIQNLLEAEFSTYSRYFAPVVEESFKAAYVIALVRKGKIGFMVDAAIAGFAIGAGFAFVENIFYLITLPDPNLLLWLIRGLGTAIMHGGATAIVGIITKNLSDRHSAMVWTDVLPGLATAIVLHSLFNHFFLDPVVSTVSLLIVMPAILALTFRESEKATRHWLGLGLDTDIDLLEMITTGNFPQTRIGTYFQSLKAKFPGEHVADMLCLLRIHVELSIRAKGLLLMRKEGFIVPPGPDIEEKFTELRYLEKNLGTTGRLAMAPVLRTSSRDLWKIHMLSTARP